MCDACPILTGRLAGANLMGSDLYNHLIRYFVAHLKELKDVSSRIFRRVVSQLIVASSGIRSIAGRGVAAILCPRMGPIYYGLKLYQPAIHVS